LPSAAPTSPIPQDVFIPGRLIYVKGSTIYMVHHYDAPIPLAVNARQPSVSPDGAKLAYVSFSKNFQNLMLLPIQSRKPELFLDDSPTVPTDVRTGKTAAMPAWSNDGKSLYFSWSAPGSPFASVPGSVVYQTDFSITRCAIANPCNTSSAQTLTKPYFETGGDYEAAPRLADPNYLVYTKWQYQQARNNTSESLPSIQSRDLTNGTEKGLTDPLDNVSEPVWSPNGRYLAFVKTSDDLQSSSVWIMAFHPPGRAADYTKARLLVTGSPFAAHPVFSPDGKYIAYLQTASDGRLHIYIAAITFGQDAHIGTPQEVKRADVVDGDRLAWAPS
jgi:dipeptidyl aminopeptidase/acylaminoacyl peptidase